MFKLTKYATLWLLQGVTPMEVDAAAVASSTVATANNTSQGVGELEAINSTGAAAAVAPHQTPCVDSKPIVLLYGPPMAGTSTQARLLAERYDVPVVTVDTLLQVIRPVFMQHCTDAYGCGTLRTSVTPNV